ncbi:MAG: protein-disulfide reductase DsbD [Enterovibrio sp.]
MPISQAFAFNFLQKDNKLVLEWQIAQGYYLYRDKFTIDSSSAKFGKISFSDGEMYEDAFFGNTQIYRNNFSLNVPIVSSEPDATISVTYQGCAQDGYCYPPHTVDVPLTQTVIAQIDEAADLKIKPARDENSPQAASQETTISELINTNKNEQAADEAQSGSNQSLPNSQNVTSLAQNWWQPLLFLAFGIGLAFTPCVLPMYPILTGIVLGQGKRTQKQTFYLSMMYVQGMAVTYTGLGLVVAIAGLQFQAALQHPYVLMSLSALFFVLALAMFGAFSLQLPSSLQTKLASLSNKQSGGNSSGVFIMGAISGLVCSPCTTAPLSGALLYVAQSGDLLTGMVTLYALAIGMGIPLIVAAMFGNKLLPKAGNWMKNVKIIFGFILLAVPLFLLERMLSTQVSTLLWLTWLLTTLGWLYHLKNQLPAGKRKSILGLFVSVGISASLLFCYDRLQDTNNYLVEKPKFIEIKTTQELRYELAKAKQAQKPVLLDFYADWCVACKQFERDTFSDPQVARAMQEFVLLQANVTKNDANDVALLEEMQVLGLPTIDFWDRNGAWVEEARVSGFLKAADFLKHLNTIKSER